MYLIIWDDGSASSFTAAVLTPTLLRANENGEVVIVRWWGDNGFERLDDGNASWSKFDDYKLSDMGSVDDGSPVFDEDEDEDDETYLDDEPGSVDIDPEEEEED